MSETPSRGLLPQRFRDLREYLCQIGEHINLIYKGIEKLEKGIEEVQSEHRLHMEKNQKELQQIKDTMVTKLEVESLLHDLDEAVKGTFPLIVSIAPVPMSQNNIQEAHAQEQ